MKIAITRITPDPGQPRQEFPADELSELADSIAEKGLLQPVLIRTAEAKNRFWLIADERRWRAHGILVKRGLDRFSEIEADLREIASEADLREVQIMENVHRAAMRPMETAIAYANLASLRGSDEEAAQRLRIPIRRFREKVSLMRLDGQVATILRAGQLSEADAIELARLPRQADQCRLLRLQSAGKLGQWKSLRAAVNSILEGVTQADFFGGAAKATSADRETLSGMEARIERVATALAHGWRDGQCIIAVKVSPDRAGTLADKLSAIRGTIRRMEQELRNTTAQGAIVLDKFTYGPGDLQIETTNKESAHP